MTGSFRLHRPSLPERLVRRADLVARLALRRTRRLTTVVAGPGFGKTALLVSAIEDLAGDPSIRDVWLSCEPSDASAQHLAAGLVAAMGLPMGASIDDLIDAVWTEAPTQVCLVLDDVHEIPGDSTGAVLLRRLVDDLPGNGHLVLASRDTVPFRIARLAANGQLVRVTESDLIFSDSELATFASLAGVEGSLLSSTGGWPALAELTASAGADLVFDYLWEEVVSQLGTRRASLLARFAVVGGGDDAIVTALAGCPTTVDQLIASLPLVNRTTTGWAELHPLWKPALRRLLDSDASAQACRRAARIHVESKRFGAAIDLLAEAEAWDEMLSLIRSVLLDAPGSASPVEIGRWYGALPEVWRARPEALLAAGIELQARSPIESLSTFAVAALGFRGVSDVDGELAAMEREGMVRWWIQDFAGLLNIHRRAVELAADGSPRAAAITRVGNAAVSHLKGDSAGVLWALRDVGTEVGGWLHRAQWLRSVAYRRNGDLQLARQELVAAASSLPGTAHDLQIDIAELRIEWLEGRVDEVRARLPEISRRYQQAGDLFLAKEATLELACKTAWFGEVELTNELLTSVQDVLGAMPGSLAQILRLIATAGAAVGSGDEAAAAAILRANAEAWQGTGSWYWKDRAALALLYVLVPDSRSTLDDGPIHPIHAIGLVLARALVAAREGDLAVAQAMNWPRAGSVRAHLPLRWAVELAAAARAAGNPAPPGVLQSADPRLRPTIRTVIKSTRVARVTAAAQDLLAELPGVPPYHVHIAVLGPLQVFRDDDPVIEADLRRKRVRELLIYLVVFRRVRREAVAAEIWPELSDGGRNLRVTLSYLQRVMQPDRTEREAPFFVRTEGDWLVLTGDERLTVDLWDLEAHLDRADAAERAGSPSEALAAYGAALPLWRSGPFVDVLHASWAQAMQARLQTRYLAAAVRVGELLLAGGNAAEARDAARRAIVADPFAEPAYSLLMRSLVACGEVVAARDVIEMYRTALADLDLRPTPATVALLTPR